MKNTFKPLHYTNKKRSDCSVKPQWFLQLNRKRLSFLHKIVQLQPRRQYFQLVFCHFQLAILAGSALKDLTQVHQVTSLPSTVAFSGFYTHGLLKYKSVSCIHRFQINGFEHSQCNEFASINCTEYLIEAMLYTRLFLSEENPKFRTTVALIFLKYNNGLALHTTVEQILK